MKLSLKWISEYVKLPTNLSPQKLAYDLTMTTVEVEGIHDLSQSFHNMVVGKVLQVKPHPNADRLRVTTTEIAPGQTKEIVCGGSNLYDGMLVAVAMPGAKVKWHGQGDLIELGLAKIRGVESFGMICNADEIGLGTLFPAASDHEIVDLSSLGLAVGQPLAEALGLDDKVIEIDNKSLTNRPDLWGHYGIARELAAIYSLPLEPLVDLTLPSSSGPLKVNIQDARLCRRYTATLIENLKSEPSPLWLKTRLSTVGQRPISLLVDLTNYVMLALGQPTHAFDLAKLTGPQISVRSAIAGEKLLLLDDRQIELPANGLLIADQSKPLALAGVMGGKDSGVSAQTQAVVLESANFEPVETRKLSNKLGVRTESSIRFEKGLDPERAILAVKLFVNTLKQIQPAAKVTAFIDSFPTPQKPVNIKVSRDFIVSRIGLDLKVSEIQALLQRFGFGVVTIKDQFEISVPSWRATGDVSIPEDIVEEVARLYGYDNLGFIAPVVKLSSAVSQPRADLERRISEYLAYSAGMQEVFSYPWVEDKYIEAAGLTDLSCLTLFSPPAPTSSKLQPSLVPNMLAAISKNLHYARNFSLFEIRRVFPRQEMQIWGKAQELLPVQPKHLVFSVVGEGSSLLLRNAKGILEDLFPALAVSKLSFEVASEKATWAAPGTVLAIKTAGKVIGHLGLLSLKAAKLAEIERAKVAVLELNLTELQILSVWEKKFQELPRFPLVEYDLALIVADSVKWADLQTAISKAHKLIKSVQFFDEYRGSQIPAGSRSVALKLTLGDKEATLTNDKIQSAVDSVLSAVKSEYGVSLR